MKKIQDFIKNLGLETKEAFQQFPITMSLVTIWTIILVLEDSEAFLSWEHSLIGHFFGLFMAGSFFIETVERTNKKRKMLLEIIPGAIAIVFIFFLYKENPFFDGLEKNALRIIWGGVYRYIYGYCALALLLSIYIWYQRSNMPISTYCMKVMQQIGRATVIYTIIGMGGAFIIGSFCVLILDGMKFGIVSKYEILVFGIFYIPALAQGIQDTTEEISKFAIRIVKFVLLPLNFACAVIMYLYIIKLFIPFTIPSNQIFRMLSIQLISGMIIWTLIGHFKDETLFMRIADKLPYFFLPLLILQGYTLGIRLAYYGLTPSRYLGLVLMIIEFIYFCIYRMHRERIGDMLIILSIAITIATLTPGINMMDMSIRNQKTILSQVKAEDIDEAPQVVWDRMYAAYQWMARQPECQKYLQKYYGEDTVALMRQNSTAIGGTIDGKIDVYGNDLVTEMDVADYTTATVYYATCLHDANIAKITFEQSQTQSNVATQKVLNLQDIFIEYMQYEQQFGDGNNTKLHTYMKEHNDIQINDHQIFYIDAISFSYQRTTNTVLQYKIKGILLEKETQ